MNLPLPENEAARVDVLRRFRILDTPPEQSFDDLTRLTAYICGTPMALIGFMDGDRLWFKSRLGWDVPEVPREMSFCAHTILQSDVLVVSDTLEDRGRLAECPLATHGGVRFYAGATLLSSEGYALGTLCAMDSAPRGLTARQIESLRQLSRQTVSLLETRRQSASSKPDSGPERPSQNRSFDTRYRSVVESAPDAIIQIDEDSRILFANQAAETVFGYSREELIGRSLTVLMPERFRERHLQSVRRYVETGVKHFSWQALTFPGLRKNGEQFALEISIGENREKRRTFTAVCRDVSARAYYDRARSRLAAIVESSADAILAKTLDGIITDWNVGAERIYGYAAGEVLGKHVSILAPAELAAEMTSILETVKQGRQVEQHETVRMKKDGTRFPISLSVSPMYDANGQVVGASSVGRDITLRKEAQERLRQSEQRLQSIIASAMDAIITVDNEQRVVMFNRAAEQVFRCTAAEALGQTLEKFIPERFRGVDRGQIEPFRESSMTDRRIYTPGTLFAVRANGEEFPIEATISQVETEGETLFTVIVRDIGARLEMEAELRQAQKIEAVGNLAGGIAHEFNNYLGVILGYTELLSEGGAENRNLTRCVTEIRNATQHAASLTKQLLSFSRKQVLKPQVLDLNRVIWESHKLLRRLLPANIDLVPVLASAASPVKIDPGQLQQILINLLVNARDAMPRGGKVTIETAPVEFNEAFATQHVGFQPGKYVLLSITDTGTGMNAETLSHLFEPFYTTKGPGKGTGLGLSTIYGIVKHNGGQISVDSTEGKGTSFHIYLPHAEGPGEESESTTSVSREETAKATILVVEDEAALRRLISASLEKRGHRVLPAKDGYEAIELFHQCATEIQVVVSDLVMPHMDGLELKRRIVSLKSDIKFLFMSGYAEDVVEQEQQALEGCAFLQKPFAPEELANKISTLLAGDVAA